LSGTLPFQDSNNLKVYQKIRKGQYELSSGVWEAISTEAKDLITQMLTVDPTQRITAQQVHTHTHHTHTYNTLIFLFSLFSSHISSFSTLDIQALQHAWIVKTTSSKRPLPSVELRSALSTVQSQRKLKVTSFLFNSDLLGSLPLNINILSKVRKFISQNVLFQY
jgi:serine/threonine protein kinase